MDHGGFSHGEVAEKYSRNQLDEEYFLSRAIGYKSLSELLQRKKIWNNEHILLDFLAGNGTFSRVAKALFKETPRYIGHDVSLEIALEGMKNGEAIIYGDIRNSIIKDELADFGICAYGSHHIPINMRQEFINNCYKKLKPSGSFIFQDFETNTTTARWYSEVINTYRPCGHRYKHFYKEELVYFFKQATFSEISIEYIYDPFILKANREEPKDDLRLRFYEYLISLFSLDKINSVVAGFSKEEKLAEYDKLFLHYFDIEEDKLDKCFNSNSLLTSTMLTNKLNVFNVNKVTYLIAPRIAIAAVGTKI